MAIERETNTMSEFMKFLAHDNTDGERLPSLNVLSKQLGISVAALREQLEVARALGLVEVRPKTGIRRLPYTFTPAVLHSLTYAAAVDKDYFFRAFSDLRTHVEAAYWYQAVSLLTPEDHQHLYQLIEQAEEKLKGYPVHIPHAEHRELHLSIYSRLNNPFVTGILEAYWGAYEAVGLNLYTDMTYLRHVWGYHRRMVQAICDGDAYVGYQALLEHTDLLMQRTDPIPRPVARQEFE